MSEIDPRLVFLERASARLFLVNIGEMGIDTAFNDLVACLQCSCSREMVERWERDFPPVKRSRPIRRAAA
jgi:hypothetical protein